MGCGRFRLMARFEQMIPARVIVAPANAGAQSLPLNRGRPALRSRSWPRFRATASHIGSAFPPPYGGGLGWG